MYHERLIASKDRLARTTQERLEKLRNEYADNPGFRRAVMRAERSPETASATNVLAIARAMTATFFPDVRRSIALNDAIDWQHAIVPLAFCDAVLLDGATANAAEQVRAQVARHPDSARLHRGRRRHRPLHRRPRRRGPGLTEGTVAQVEGCRSISSNGAFVFGLP
jgi:hypothetical protein